MSHIFLIGLEALNFLWTLDDNDDSDLGSASDLLLGLDVSTLKCHIYF